MLASGWFGGEHFIESRVVWMPHNASAPSNIKILLSICFLLFSIFKQPAEEKPFLVYSFFRPRIVQRLRQRAAVSENMKLWSRGDFFCVCVRVGGFFSRLRNTIMYDCIASCSLLVVHRFEMYISEKLQLSSFTLNDTKSGL